MENENAYRVILARYLGLALAPFGIIGFWGVSVDKGMIVFNKKESSGEVVFLDLKNSRMIAAGEILTIPQNFKIIRLDNHLKSKHKIMGKEELFSFLSVNCIYFDYGGKNLPVRQLIKTLVQKFKGYIYPKENFRDTLDLSL